MNQGVHFVFIVLGLMTAIAGLVCLVLSPAYSFLLPIGVFVFIIAAVVRPSDLPLEGAEVKADVKVAYNPDPTDLVNRGVFESDFQVKKRMDPVKHKEFD